MADVKVCIMTSVHPAEDIRIYEKEAKALARAGYKVMLLNSFKEKIISPNLRQIKVQSFKSRRSRICFSWGIYFQKAMKTKAEIIHFHDPELLPAGLLLKFCGKKVIYDIHEDLPVQILYKPYLSSGMRKFLSSAAEITENIFSRFFDVNICATETIAKRFTKAQVIYNYPLLSEYNQYKQYIKPYSQREKCLCYVGAITENRGIFNMLDTVENTDLLLTLAGEFEDENTAMRCKIHWGFKNTEYIGFVDRQNVIKVMGESKIGLLLLNPTVNYMEALPIKMFEYFMSATPVICSNFPYWKNLFGDCAIYVNSTNPKEVRSAINMLLTNPEQAEKMGKRGQTLVLEKYSFEKEEKKLLTLYKALARPGHG